MYTLFHHAFCPQSRFIRLALGEHGLELKLVPNGSKLEVRVKGPTVTSGYHNEGPTFAPNGRVLMFFRDPGGNSGPSLYTVDLSGRNDQRVQTPSYASDPAWSPLLS